jgi:hypothetical protein
MLWLNWMVTRVAAAAAADQVTDHGNAAAAELVGVGRQHLLQMCLKHATHALLLTMLYQVLQSTNQST